MIYCNQKNRYDAPRQGVFQQPSEQGIVVLHKGMPFAQVLSDLDGFERIWLIFGFHLNQGFRPMVMPPAHLQRKVGVFASRSPYRPSGLGLSCVRLEQVKAATGEIVVSEFDLLDQTPIFDIKPYIAYSDSFPGARAGWVENKDELYEVKIHPDLNERIEWLQKQGGPSLDDFIVRQLCREPASKKRKRVYRSVEEGVYLLAYRTWRVQFSIDEAQKKVDALTLFSGYSEEKMNEERDPYHDKALHRKFTQKFN